MGLLNINESYDPLFSKHWTLRVTKSVHPRWDQRIVGFEIDDLIKLGDQIIDRMAEDGEWFDKTIMIANAVHQSDRKQFVHPKFKELVEVFHQRLTDIIWNLRPDLQHIHIYYGLCTMGTDLYAPSINIRMGTHLYSDKLCDSFPIQLTLEHKLYGWSIQTPDADSFLEFTNDPIEIKRYHVYTKPRD